MNNFFSNQVTAIILAPLRFSRPDGANDIGSVPAPPDFSRYGRFLEASFLEPLERFLEVAGGS